MLAVLSPAKALDFDSEVEAPTTSQPHFLEASQSLIHVLKRKSAGDLKKLMGLSDNLAQLNRQRYQSWRSHTMATQAAAGAFRECGLAFDGPAFRGLNFAALDKASQLHLQEHLVILSGLYGGLRPCDLIQPYRLEMGTKLPVDATRDLYAFWAAKGLSAWLAERVAKTPSKILVNVASQEYFKVVDTSVLQEKGCQVVEVVFQEAGRVVSVFAKRARGLFVRHMAQRQAKTLGDLRAFNAENYKYDAKASTDSRLVFNRTSRPTAAAASSTAASKRTKPTSAPSATVTKKAKPSPAPKKHEPTQAPSPPPETSRRVTRSSRKR
ncbi:uncharacterized protein MONBRDRAFT_27937 [Monosiga brevicollis MX1]|uniref:Uncharacterized protein n=1 Tax=Monosiga brevicollis TaxID=81824 RepID=A9V6G6_MONBE|nr:uncharacterized protein MONBRDRAFT_27937 [Monosiga brevicollis MX1]EDQ86804.1 predicted protein [Monosiga brevicollis MX1]|eukprot:XP_001748349.1 hypothetical protein [Monosiga brevicollis MX1]